MSNRVMIFAALVAAILMSTSNAAPPASSFELRDQDRVVFLGNTLVERAQKYGYWESYITACYPGRDIEFRNLGWSGDTVWADSRGIFDPPAKGYARMVEQIQELKPTVLVIAYGGNEAFNGEEKLAAFRQQLEKLLTDINAAEMRVVVVSPLAHEHAGPPLPNPHATNQLLQVYSNELRSLAQQRNYHFIDLFAATFHRGMSNTQKPRLRPPLTDNGVHLTESGYRQLTHVWREAMQLSVLNWEVNIDTKNSQESNATRASIRNLQIDDSRLQFTLDPEYVSDGRNRITVNGLAEGDYSLLVDARPVVTASAQGWATGLQWNNGPDTQQFAKLREAIIDKNQLYFYRWRPQNITYLFGFRKHEQRQNAKEIAEFDPLVTAQEAKIKQLKQPRPLSIEIVPQ